MNLVNRNSLPAQQYSYVLLVLVCGKIRFVVRAEIGANTETNCCCCILAPRRDALGASHCA